MWNRGSYRYAQALCALFMIVFKFNDRIVIVPMGLTVKTYFQNLGLTTE